VIMSRGSYKWD